MIFEPKGPPRYAHQNRGLRKLIETKGVCALLFDPGMGKTMTSLDFASILALKAEPDARGEQETRVLVVCPIVAMDTWVIQAEKYVSDQVSVWAEVLGGSITQKGEALAARNGRPFRKDMEPSLHINKAVTRYIRPSNGSGEASGGPRAALGNALPRLVIEVVNLDSFSSRTRMGSRTIADFMVEAVERFDPELVIVDEMHKIKSVSSNVSRLMARIGSRVPRRIGLTGTVMPKGPIDVYAQWRFLAPQAFGMPLPGGGRKTATAANFKERFGVMGGYMGREIVGYRNLDEMERIMAQNASVAKKEDSLDLPEVTEVVVPVHLSGPEQAAYAEMKKSLQVQLQNGGEANVTNRLAQLMRLRQITSGHLPDDDRTVHQIGSSKAKVIDGIANDMLEGEKRIVIFCLFTHEIRQLTDQLRRPGTEVLVADGSTPYDVRIAHRKRFGSDEDTRLILLAQIQTMSMAVNELVTASHAIFGSLSQRRDDLVQAQDRLHRIGQTKPVTFWYALAPGTVDEVIMESHRQRTNLEKAMLTHILGHE